MVRMGINMMSFEGVDRLDLEYLAIALYALLSWFCEVIHGSERTLIELASSLASAVGMWGNTLESPTSPP